jgi:hypothetical protein
MMMPKAKQSKPNQKNNCDKNVIKDGLNLGKTVPRR